MSVKRQRNGASICVCVCVCVCETPRVRLGRTWEVSLAVTEFLREVSSCSQRQHRDNNCNSSVASQKRQVTLLQATDISKQKTSVTV